MKKEIYSANRGAKLAAQTDKRRVLAIKRALKRMIFALAIIGIAGTSSGCLVVRDDQGHHHWRWHHDHDDHDVDHHDHD